MVHFGTDATGCTLQDLADRKSSSIVELDRRGNVARCYISESRLPAPPPAVFRWHAGRRAGWCPSL